MYILCGAYYEGHHTVYSFINGHLVCLKHTTVQGDLAGSTSKKQWRESLKHNLDCWEKLHRQPERRPRLLSDCNRLLPPC